MSSFNLKQHEIAVEEVHRNLPPAPSTSMAFFRRRMGVSAEVKTAAPVA
jgi:hypothetical protein